MDSASSQADAPLAQETSLPFVSRWNQLVSSTNWEKGRIIHQWREALAATDAPASDYSDEAWAQRVGGVTGQHVSRLRRVWQRFGDSFKQYGGLFWSHFHAALDWDDAEMWLEGAVQNGWSVSQLRRTRWETLGSLEDQRPVDQDIVDAETDEDFEPALNEPPSVTSRQEEVRPVGDAAEEHDPDDDEAATHSPTGRSRDAGRAEGQAAGDEGAAIYAEDDRESVQFVRPFANIAELPEDVAEAFESMKLAILRHKSSDWVEITREEMLGAIEALKELALAPTSDEGPF